MDCRKAQNLELTTVKKADILKRKWRKDIEKDTIREERLDEIRLKIKEEKVGN